MGSAWLEVVARIKVARFRQSSASGFRAGKVRGSCGGAQLLSLETWRGFDALVAIVEAANKSNR